MTRVGVLEEGALHLLLDVDVDDPLDEVLVGGAGGVLRAMRVGAPCSRPAGAGNAPSCPRLDGPRPRLAADLSLAETAPVHHVATASAGAGAGSASWSARRLCPRATTPTSRRLSGMPSARRTGVVLLRRHAEEERAEALVDGGEQHEHRRHARVDVPVGHRPPRLGRGRSSPCRARRSGRGRRPCGQAEHEHRAPPACRAARRRRPRRAPSVARPEGARGRPASVEHDEVPALAEPGAGSAARRCEAALDDLGAGPVGRGRSGAPCGGDGRPRENSMRPISAHLPGPRRPVTR